MRMEPIESRGRRGAERSERRLSLVSGGRRTGVSSWPEELRRAVACWRAAERPAERERRLGDAWRLLSSAVTLYALAKARRLSIRREDVRDIVSTKCVELAERLRDGSWRPDDLDDARLRSFLGTLARNAVVDHFRRREAREQPLEAHEDEQDARRAPEDTERIVEGRAFVTALVGCLATLTPRARDIWLLRSLLELSGDDVARHPRVRTTRPAVDMALSRARRALGECMKRRGYSAFVPPPGMVARLWFSLADRDLLPWESKRENDDG